MPPIHNTNPKLLLGTIGLAILSILLWPIRVLLRKRRSAGESNPVDPAAANAASHPADESETRGR